MSYSDEEKLHKHVHTFSCSSKSCQKSQALVKEKKVGLPRPHAKRGPSNKAIFPFFPLPCLQEWGYQMQMAGIASNYSRYRAGGVACDLPPSLIGHLTYLNEAQDTVDLPPRQPVKASGCLFLSTKPTSIILVFCQDISKLYMVIVMKDLC